MGKLVIAEKVLVRGHGTHLAPTPKNLLESTTGRFPPISPPTIVESTTSDDSYEGHPRRNGHLGHPTRSGANTHKPDSVSTYEFTFIAPCPSNSAPDVPPFSAPSSHIGVVDVASSRPAMSKSQHPALISSLLTQELSNPTGAPRKIGVCRPGPEPATQTPPKPPRVKACLLSAGGRDMPVLQDASLVMRSLDRVRNLDPENITIRTGKTIDCAFDNFFDPADIRKGGLLILIISGHGKRRYDGDVSLEFHTQNGTPVSSGMLQQKIMALPEHCTLEVIVDTCFAEGVVPGLRRIMATEHSTPSTIPTGIPHSVACTPLSSLSLSLTAPASLTGSDALTNVGLPKQAPSPLAQEAESTYKAKVVVWAASATWGRSYPEANLPGKPGVYSIMIGAMFNHLCSNGPNINRREVWEIIVNAVEDQNDARRERDLCKAAQIQARLVKENRIQRPVLLTSVNDSDDVLNGCLFHPIRKARRTFAKLD
ncbi:hypothetical protein RSOLAG22IIIB_11238 [Rhizoctonia solani]|uniref:Uncharacterized protein n=1 Tax=Rhizoctonia solani TaxID=456999 RepID=A0A0K6G7A2_9AGAM|nr:hypothetical protein RSOLAG22IIIB_11238 [Rhizoctonia solani]